MHTKRTMAIVYIGDDRNIPSPLKDFCKENGLTLIIYPTVPNNLDQCEHHVAWVVHYDGTKYPEQLNWIPDLPIIVLHGNGLSNLYVDISIERAGATYTGNCKVYPAIYRTLSKKLQTLLETHLEV